MIYMSEGDSHFRCFQSSTPLNYCHEWPCAKFFTWRTNIYVCVCVYVCVYIYIYINETELLDQRLCAL